MSDLLIVGCGYLGRRIAMRALREGRCEKVIGTTRSLETANLLRTLSVDPIIADVLSPESFERLSFPKTIVYCVGFDRKSGKPMRTIYVDGLAMFLDKLKTAQWNGRMVYTSSTGVYGQADGAWVDEESAAEPLQESGRVCLDAETLLSRMSAQNGWSAVVVRLAGLYGPGRIVQKNAIANGEPIVGDPSRWLNLIHVDDAARCVLGLSELGNPRALYVASDDRPVHRGEYYTALARHLAAPAPTFTPAPAGSHLAGREASNKRVRNARIKTDLGISLAYPDVSTGIPASLAEDLGTCLA